MAQTVGDMIVRKPRLALISTGIRRDLLAPLRFVQRLELLHLYRRSEYGDLIEDDYDSSLLPYDSALTLYRHLVAAKADVIQTVEPFSWYQQPALWASFLAARRTRARLLVVSFENRPLALKFNRLLAALLCSAVRPVLRHACLVIPMNRGAEQNLRECGVAPARMKRVLWGAWGVDVEEFSPRATDSPVDGTGGRSPTILFAGRLVREKGIFVLLDAFARVKRVLSRARWIVAGEGAARAELARAIARRGLQDDVALLGMVKHRAMAEVFRSAHVVAVPSLTTRRWAEQVGMVALQAMACGVPVVASNSGALPEYVPDGLAGKIVPENDAEALAEALVEILSADAERTRLARTARAFACQHYDARANIARAEAVVLECCANRI